MPSLRSPCRIKCSFVRSGVKRLADRAGAAGRGTAFGNKPHPPDGRRDPAARQAKSTRTSHRFRGARGFTIRDARLGSRFEILDSGCGMPDAGCGMRDAGLAIRDQRLGMRDCGAGYGDRTRLAGLGSQSITTMLSPHRSCDRNTSGPEHGSVQNPSSVHGSPGDRRPEMTTTPIRSVLRSPVRPGNTTELTEYLSPSPAIEPTSRCP